MIAMIDDYLIGSLAVVGILLVVNVTILLLLNRRRVQATTKLQKELGVLNRTLLKERQELEKRDDEIGHLSGKLQEQLQSNRVLGEDFQTALNDSAQSKEGVELLRKRLAEMETHMRAREAEAAQMARRTADLEMELEATQAEIEGLRMSMDQQIRQFEIYSTSLLQVRQRLEQQLQNCQDALRKSQVELADARRTIAELNARAVSL